MAAALRHAKGTLFQRGDHRVVEEALFPLSTLPRGPPITLPDITFACYKTRERILLVCGGKSEEEEEKKKKRKKTRIKWNSQEDPCFPWMGNMDSRNFDFFFQS